MTPHDAHPSTQSVFDYLVWVPAGFYSLFFVWWLIDAPFDRGAALLLFSVAIFALLGFAHRANARRIRELDATVRHLRSTLR